MIIWESGREDLNLRPHGPEASSGTTTTKTTQPGFAGEPCALWAGRLLHKDAKLTLKRRLIMFHRLLTS
jgi:hypothetical protein